MNWRFPLLVVVMFGASAPAREWRSSDGSRTLEAEFGGLKDGKLLLKTPDGKSTVVPASAFSQEDQKFAQQAQVTLEAALNAKPVNFEVTQLLQEGCLCRVITELVGQKGVWLASGTPFLVLANDDLHADRGARLMAKTLYHAGARTFQALDGTTTPINAYSLALDEAVNTTLALQFSSGGDPAKQAPLVMEPKMEKITVRGLGLPIGRGYFITDVAFADGKHPVAIHHEGGEVPATLVKKDTKNGLALVQCDAVDVPAGVFIARDGATFGQNIFVASMSLNSTRRSFEPVTLTTGIVGRLIDTTRFQHDAPLVPDAIGGFVLSERMEVLGVFFAPETRVVGSRSSTGGTQAAPRGITECQRSEILEALLSEGSSGKRLPGVPEPRRGSIGSNKQAASDMLRKLCVIVVSNREIAKPTPAATGTPTATPGGGPATGWSISSSGTRHNAKCRFYNAAAPCQAAEGKACKICGG